MATYTPEQVELRARHFDNAGIMDIASMLRAYAATLRQQAARVDEVTCRRAFCDEDGYGEARLGTRDYQVFRDGFFAGARVAATCKGGLQVASLNEPSGNSGELGAPTAWIVRRTYSHPTAAVATLTFDEAVADDCRERGGDVTPLFTRDALEATLSAQPAERQGAVAWLHTVTQGDGETDQALSFSPDSFPLDTELGFRSLGALPLYLHPAAPVGVPDGTCSRCNGTGEYMDYRGNMSQMETCYVCDGSGKAAAPSAPQGVE